VSASPSTSPSTFDSVTDGYITSGLGEGGTNTWAELHDASDGATYGGGADYTAEFFFVQIQSSTVSGQWYVIARSVVFFPETADIPDGDTVTSASLFLYVTSKINGFGGVKLQVVSATPGTENVLTTQDFDQFGTTVLGEIAVADIVENAYNEIVLDPSAINKTGTTVLGLRFDKDVNNDSTYASNATAYVAIDSTEHSNPSHHPFLTTVH